MVNKLPCTEGYSWIRSGDRFYIETESGLEHYLVITTYDAPYEKYLDKYDRFIQVAKQDAEGNYTDISDVEYVHLAGLKNTGKLIFESIEKPNVLQVVAEHYGVTDTPYNGPTFILPNGKFLNILGCSHHSDVEKWLIDNGYSTQQYIKTAGSATLYQLGCIRCDVTKYYLSLPGQGQPTGEQYNTLLVWLDYLQRFHKAVEVLTPDRQHKMYYFDEDVISDTVVDKIRAYYYSGVLREAKDLDTVHARGFIYERESVGTTIVPGTDIIKNLEESKLVIKENGNDTRSGKPLVGNWRYSPCRGQGSFMLFHPNGIDTGPLHFYCKPEELQDRINSGKQVYAIDANFTVPKSVEKALYRMYGKPNAVTEAYTRDLKKGDWVEVNLNVKRNGTPNIIPVKVANDLGSEFYGWAWGEGYHKYHKSHMVNKIDMDDMDAIIRKYTPTGYMKDGKDTYNEDCLVGKNLKKGDKITCPDSGEEMEVLDNMGNDGYICNIKVKYTKTGEEKTHNIGVNSEWKKSVTEDTTPQKRRISYRGYVIRLRKSDEGEQYYDIIKPSWDTREPIWDWCDSVEEAKAWIDSDKDEPFDESVNTGRTKSMYCCSECGFQGELFDDECEDLCCPKCHDHHGGFGKCEESVSDGDWVKSGNVWTKGTKKIIHSVPVRHAEGAIHKYEVLDNGKYIGHSYTLSGAQEIADGKTIKESSATHCVYFTQDGIDQIEFEGSEDECNKYISDIQAEQDNEFGDEAPERFVKRLSEGFKPEYWYFTKHGVQPGSIPKGANVLMLQDVENGTYVKLDRVLTTKELNDYEIIEKRPEGLFENTEPEKIATKADGSFLVRADSGLGYTAYSKDNVCLGGVNTDDEEEAKRKFNYGELDESVLSISDLRRYYETSTSIDREKYPNFPTWYNYMVRSGKYKMEKLVPAAKQIRESVQLTEEEKVLQLAVALLWEMDNFVMSVYDNEGWLMNGPGDGEFDEDTYEEVYNNYEDHTWLITDIDTGLFCASDFADFIDTFESCTSSRRDYDQEERNKIITTAKTLLGHQPTVTEDVEDSDFLEEDDSYWIVYRNESEVERFYNIDEAYDLYNEIECEIERADEGESVELKEFNEANSYSGETLEFHENDPAGNAADRAYDDYVDRMLFDESLTEEDDADFDEPDTADQQYTSARTSINSAKLPAIFKMVNFEPGTVNLDIGGGKFDNAAEALAQNNITNLVWDPYNRSNEHNRSVLTQVKKNGGADTVTNSNVLNVIQEPEARLAVIKNCFKYLKNGGTAYFTVYEGSGSGEGGVTKSGYQLNKKTADYVEEIQQVFGNVKRKGKLIIATK